METFSALLVVYAGNSPHKGQWLGALIFSLICVWIYNWVNNREAGDLRRYRAHCDVNVMSMGEYKVLKSTRPRDLLIFIFFLLKCDLDPVLFVFCFLKQSNDCMVADRWYEMLLYWYAAYVQNANTCQDTYPACVIHVTTVRTRSSKTVA